MADDRYVLRPIAGPEACLVSAEDHVHPPLRPHGTRECQGTESDRAQIIAIDSGQKAGFEQLRVQRREHVAQEFLSFMSRRVAAFPGRELHVILDNLNTDKKNERRLKQHPYVHFHFIPTRSSWLNQVETWFSILQAQSLNAASSTAVEQLQKHVDAFITACNETAEPFDWTKKKVLLRRQGGTGLVGAKLVYSGPACADPDSAEPASFPGPTRYRQCCEYGLVSSGLGGARSFSAKPEITPIRLPPRPSWPNIT